MANILGSFLSVIAGILDFVTVFLVGGFVIACFAGGLTSSGFKLEGFTALALFGLIIAYYVIANRYFGGPLWKHLLGVDKA